MRNSAARVIYDFFGFFSRPMTKYTFRNKLVNFRNFSIVESDVTVNLGRPKSQKNSKTGKYMRDIFFNFLLTVKVFRNF